MCKNLTAHYLDNQFFRDTMFQLDSIIDVLNLTYFRNQNIAGTPGTSQ